MLLIEQLAFAAHLVTLSARLVLAEQHQPVDQHWLVGLWVPSALYDRVRSHFASRGFRSALRAAGQVGIFRVVHERSPVDFP